jgi:O-succinylbenzoic acid--CoA ligase
VVLHPRFEPAAVARSLKNDAVTLISVVPTMLHRLLDNHADALTVPHLRCILIGGAALSPQLAERCIKLSLPIATTYGLTEAASQVVTASPAQTRNKPGSVGRPLLFSAVWVVNAAGNPVPIGEIGEIVVRGPTVMAGYYHQPEATTQTVRHGELFTGDMGYLDDDGDLWVVQRRADLIVSGGENVYPVEVENALRAHPAVSEACVVGLPDAEWGQRVAAAVVLHPGHRVTNIELLDFCRARLAGYKVPRTVRFVEILPQTASGKVQREEVKLFFVV